MITKYYPDGIKAMFYRVIEKNKDGESVIRCYAMIQAKGSGISIGYRVRSIKEFFKTFI